RGVQTLLPPLDSGIFGMSVLDKIQASFRSERTPHFEERSRDVRYGAQRERADDRVEARVRNWQLLRREPDDLDRERRRRNPFSPELRGCPRRVDADKLRDRGPIVREVEASSDADFENSALHVLQASGSLFPYRLRVHRDVEEVRQNAVFVE